METRMAKATELLQSIESGTGETLHRFEIHHADGDEIFLTASEVIERASQLSITSFEFVSASGQVSKMREEPYNGWMREDGVSLGDIQANTDDIDVRAICARYDMRKVLKGDGSIDAWADRQMAIADYLAFSRIGNPVHRVLAGMLMTEHCANYSAYAAALDGSNDLVSWGRLVDELAATYPQLAKLTRPELENKVNMIKSVTFTQRLHAIWLADGDISLAAKLLRVDEIDLLNMTGMEAQACFCSRPVGWVPANSLAAPHPSSK